MRVFVIAFFASFLPTGASTAQIAIHPTSIRPAAWERIAIRVVNQTETPIVHIDVRVPEVLDILGVEPLGGWSFELARATASTPQSIQWTEGELGQWEFREFAFYGRTGPDVREKELIFPVIVTKGDGTKVEWNMRDGASAPPPIIQITGTTEVSNWGSFAIAAAAMGLSLLSIAFAVSKRRTE